LPIILLTPGFLYLLITGHFWELRGLNIDDWKKLLLAILAEVKHEFLDKLKAYTFQITQ
jgi:hypothetical protein